MARLGSWDPIAVAAEWYDIDVLSSGWVDRDVVPFPIIPPPPIVNNLLYGGGGDEDEDRDYIRFFRSSHGKWTKEDERIIAELGDLEVPEARARVDSAAGEEEAPEAAGRKRVTVTVTIDGVKYVVSKDID